MDFMPEPLRLLVTSSAIGDLSSDGPLAYALRQKITGSVTIPPTLHLKSKTVLVTGATSGVGYEAARQFLSLGATLIIGARNMDKAEQSVKTLQKEYPNAEIVLMWLDMEVMGSVQEFAENLHKGGKTINIAVLNAGFYSRVSRITVDGFDALFQVNFLATAYLAQHLLPLIAPSDLGLGRLVLVLSEAHAWTRFDTQKLDADSIFEPFTTCATQDRAAEVYYTAKLFLGLFGRELATRTPCQDACIVLTTPGFCSSNFFPDEGVLTRMIKWTSARSPQTGAKLYLHAATVEPAGSVHGRYIRDGAICRLSKLAESDEGQRVQGLLWGAMEGLRQALVERR